MTFEGEGNGERPVKKRRWGSTQPKNRKGSVNISTQSLKVGSLNLAIQICHSFSQFVKETQNAKDESNLH